MEIYILGLIIVFGFTGVGLLINSKFDTKDNGLSNELLEYLKTTNVRLDRQTQHFTETLSRSSKDLNERLDNASRVIGDVQKNIGEMSEIGRGMKDLQMFLNSPKLRGNIGEQVLKDLISQMFPRSSFNLQYSFKSGEKVDAAIKTSAGILPIDSKFPMENFQKMSEGKNPQEVLQYKSLFERDIKKHINDISNKYILPEEGTMDFALMYIPSESVYYEMVNNDKLVRFAQEKRVYPVSPVTLYAHLQTILLSFEGQKIELKAREVFSMLRAVEKDYSKVEENLSVLQKHLNNAYNMMGNVVSSYSQLGQKIASTKSLNESSKK